MRAAIQEAAELLCRNWRWRRREVSSFHCQWSVFVRFRDLEEPAKSDYIRSQWRWPDEVWALWASDRTKLRESRNKNGLTASATVTDKRARPTGEGSTPP